MKAARSGCVAVLSSEYSSDGRGFTARGRGEGGDDSEDYGGIYKAWCGQRLAHDREERAVALGAEEIDGERGWSFGDGGMRCKLLRGSGGSFYGVGRGAPRRW
jgi:hypothetical protein